MPRYSWCILLFVLIPLAGFNNESGLYTVKLRPADIDADKVFLLVDKSDYRLYLYEDVTLRKIYKVVFGSRDLKDKVLQGDRQTPEGTFHIQSKRYDGRWSRFMLLDYPNEGSWAKFHQRQQQGLVGPNADIGGGIGIHGVEAASGIRDAYVDSRINWTLGCVSMKNGDVNELYDIIKVGTPVVIRR